MAGTKLSAETTLFKTGITWQNILYMISLIVLLIVFILIAVRQVGRIRLQLWQIMLLGALAVLATGQIDPLDAITSINIDVIFFLFGALVIGQALEESGYLAHLSYHLFRHAHSLNGLVLLMLFGMGGLSALLMNDTLAIVSTPVVILLARKARTAPRVLLITLAFAVTIGSAMSPIGNPQNLLIALDGHMANPFVTFLKHLLIPTLLNLLIAYVLIRVFYRRYFNGEKLLNTPEAITNPGLAKLSRLSLALLIGLVGLKILTVLAGLDIDFRLTYISLIAALPLLLASPERWGLVRRIDWHTLIFFAAMFILMQSVWDSGFFQSTISSLELNLTSIIAILALSITVSQFISNVPFVALYLPLLAHLGAGAPELVALAAGSTIAGNLTILGAASNVIIIQKAERTAKETLTFWEFFRIGLPLTILNVLVYWLFLSRF